MDIILLLIGIFCIIFGFSGCFLPALPGPPLSYAGLLLLTWSKYADFSLTLLLVLGGLVVIITIADNIIPIYMTKKLGGTNRGAWGATIGLIAGMIFGGIIGTVLGPFIGALIFELIGGTEKKPALKSALGSLIGFILGVGGKLIMSGVITFYFCRALWRYWA